MGITIMKCKSCDRDLPKTSFYLKDKKKKRYDTTCKTCRKESARQWHSDNRETSLANKKAWHEANRDKMLANMSRRYYGNREEDLESRRQWRNENPDRVKAWNDKAYKKHRDKILKQKKEYGKKNRKRINKYQREKYQNDMSYKIAVLTRSRVRDFIKGDVKESSALEYLGKDLDFVQAWLNFQFYDGMDFSNHGDYWHIDHVTPCESFDLTNEEELKKCFNWKNLQPLRAKKNISKGDKIRQKSIVEQELQAKIFEEKIWPGIEEKLKDKRYFLFRGELIFDDLFGGM